MYIIVNLFSKRKIYLTLYQDHVMVCKIDTPNMGFLNNTDLTNLY